MGTATRPGVARHVNIPWFYRSLGGKPIEDLPLPGDEGDVLKIRHTMAVRRDDLLTWEERRVKECVYVQLRYRIEWCGDSECNWCGGFKWRNW